MNMNPAIRSCTALLTAILVVGCASQGGNKEAEACPAGMAVYCETYLGKPQRCFCASRHELEDVLEPVREPF